MLTCDANDECYFEELVVVEDQVLSELMIWVPHFGEDECLLGLDKFFCKFLREETKREFSLSSIGSPAN
jgi:hypothetical protein